MINAIKILPGKSASCDAMGNMAYAKKQNVAWSKKKPGDVVQYDFNKNGTSDHTGLLEKVNKDGSIDVIEGNTSKTSDDNGGKVMRRTRYRSQVNYFIRPKYTKEVTAKMVLDTARSQIGVKEKPAGSNKVKYNTWFYGRKVSGSAYPWCMVFVCWIFAHVGIEKDKPKPAPSTGTYTGKLPAKTIKQGSEGQAVKLWQKFLRWMGYTAVLVDGDFGKTTKKYTKKAQKAFGFRGKAVDGVVGPDTIKAAKKYKKKEASKKQTPEVPHAKQVDIRTLKKVIDISWWQPTSNFNKAKQSGVDGVIVRASYTSLKKFKCNTDSRFKTHLNNAVKAGVPVGAYHYSQAVSVAEAKAEAEYIIKVLAPYKNKINLPVCFDCEFGNRFNSDVARKLGKAGMLKIIKAFCDTIKAAGYTPMVYLNYNMCKNYVSHAAVKKAYLLWYAQYNTTASYDYDIWQYTSNGTIAGIPGSVDVNKVKKKS